MPILAKYRLIGARYALFIEASPSFRLSGNKNGYEPSNLGVTAGVGLEIRTGKVSLSPTLRRTHWKLDSSRRFSRTATNQLDLLFAFSF